eukprot:g3547.t1
MLRLPGSRPHLAFCCEEVDARTIKASRQAAGSSLEAAVLMALALVPTLHSSVNPRAELIWKDAAGGAAA